MEENEKNPEMGVVEFNINFRRLINKNSLNVDFYKFCAGIFKMYIKSNFGGRIPLEETAHDIFTAKLYEPKKVRTVANPKAWLIRVARNYVFDKLKTDPRYIRLIDNLQYDLYYEDCLERIDAAYALKKLDKLPLQVITLHYCHKFLYAEVAEILHITAESARQIACRAKPVLKNYLK